MKPAFGLLVSAFLVFPCAAEAKSWADIQAAGEISLCANPNALPFASEKGDPPGFQIEIARAIAKELGVKLRTAWIVPRRRATDLDCDLLMDTILVPGIQPPSIKTSAPYQRSGVALVFAPGREPAPSYAALKPGTRIGILHNSVASMIISRTPASMVPFGFEEDMLDAVAKGEVDAGAVSTSSAGYFNLRNPDRRISVVHAEDSEPELRWTVGVGMRRADDALVQRMNQAIATLLSDGSIAAIYARYGIEHRKP
jgi:polar amino acid transport system substrate-binding protein